ncbi:copper resistance protein CopC [Paenibacillus sp. SC116]|uniref:copper resistance CopC family protein n=1 Tax=Paenibacillus sp. SC116 TaxID=2968986 RepID=UPI00215A8C82|nr:copper resistance protein CopC [Paenibacillus sp. SC116]MCR8845003.1 copper resistance protein CopC [Paenibacillus sp. SC116]
MRKFFACILSLYLILIPTQVWAHSTLTESIPAIDAVVKEDVKALQLTFNTDILEGSKFALENEAGQAIGIDTIQIDGATLKGTTAAPLPNGKITVNWSIIGADGHLIHGNYQFTVQNEQATANKDNNQTETTVNPENNAVSKDAAVKNDPTSTTETAVSVDGQQSTSKVNGDSLLLPIIVVVLGIAVIVLFFIMKKKDAN